MHSPIVLSNYPVTPPPGMPKIDVIIHYSQSELHLVYDAVRSIWMQQHVSPIIHLVADNCKQWFWPGRPLMALTDGPTHKQIVQHVEILHYKTPTQMGPFAIVNSMVPHCHTPYIAIQDADDVSLSSRLWKQVVQLQSGFEMTSCAMLQQSIEGYDGTRHIRNPIIYPGEQDVACPGGRMINSTRTMLKEFFIDMHGFQNLPCSGDYQFDNRCTLVSPPRKLHGSLEVLGIRKLRPSSLSNGGRYAHGTTDRNSVAYSLLEEIESLRSIPTLVNARSRGALHPEGNKALSASLSTPRPDTLTTRPPSNLG